jgi:hypothetical protein
MKNLLLLIVIVSLVVIVFATTPVKAIDPATWLIVIIIIVIIVVVIWKLANPSSKMSKRFSYREYGKENRKPIPIRQKPVDKKEISAFCENCGKPLKKTAKFCGGCGTPRS